METYAGMPHCFQLLGSDLPESKTAIESAARFLAEAIEERARAATPLLGVITPAEKEPRLAKAADPSPASVMA